MVPSFRTCNKEGLQKGERGEEKRPFGTFGGEGEGFEILVWTCKTSIECCYGFSDVVRVLVMLLGC